MHSLVATRDVVTVPTGASLDAAIMLMEEHGFHHLPVVDGGRMVGMLSDRDLLLSVGWKLTAERRIHGSDGGVAGPTRVEQIMSRQLIWADLDDTLEHAARLMVDNRIGAVPVLSDGRVLAMLTDTDILRLIRFGSGALGAIDPNPCRLVNEFMHVSVKTIRPMALLTEIVRLLTARHIRHLPVVAELPSGEQELIGMVSDRDVRRALGESAVCDQQAQEDGAFYLGPMRAKDIMTSPVRTVEVTAPLSAAIEEMLRHHIHALPVVLQGRLSGLITQTDLLRAFCGGGHGVGDVQIETVLAATRKSA